MRVRGDWAAKSRPWAWRTWLEPLRFLSSAPGGAGELVIELEAASEQALEALAGELEQLEEFARAALEGRRVSLRLAVGRPR